MVKKFLVTGGAGFIGSNFIKYVLEIVHDVSIVNIDNLEYSGNLENLEDVEGNENYKFIKGDICDEALLLELFQAEEFNYVVHFAASTHVDRSIVDAKPFVITNIEGTLNLLEIARRSWAVGDTYKADTKFIYISTDEVYGDLEDGEYFTEATRIAPRNPYSASKAGAEMMVQAYGETHRLPFNITRCSNNYGPNQYPEKLIPLLINNCIHKKKLPIYGDGKNVRDWLFVKDHCIAIEAVIAEGKLGEVYNIGGHNEKTTLDIASIVIDYIHETYDSSVSRELIEYVPDRKGHDRRYAIDPTKTNEELNWRPTVLFEDGIKFTIDWYMNNRNWLEYMVNKK